MIKYQLRCQCNYEFEGWFPDKEARKAAKGKRDQNFYGTTTKEEANKLLDEGIDLFAVPDYKEN